MSHATHMDESCLIYECEWVMSHTLYECEWVMSHIWVMSHTLYGWVMSHIWMWMSHVSYIVTHLHECHTSARVKSHTSMRHVTHTNESCHTYESSHVTHMNKSRLGFIQGGADTLSCRSLSAKEPLIIGLFCGILLWGMTCKDKASVIRFIQGGQDA